MRKMKLAILHFKYIKVYGYASNFLGGINAFKFALT